MTAQIFLFPRGRIRRLAYAGELTSDVMVLSMASGVPYVEKNMSLSLMYDVMEGRKSPAVTTSPPGKPKPKPKPKRK